MERERKSRNRMTDAQSALVCEVFALNNGQWDQIMKDKRIKKMKVSKEYLATHLANKRKGAKKAAKQKLQRDVAKLDKVFKSLDDEDSLSSSLHPQEEEQEEVQEKSKKRKSESLSGVSGEETAPNLKYNNKKGRWEWDTRDNREIPWEPKESYEDEGTMVLFDQASPIAIKTEPVGECDLSGPTKQKPEFFAALKKRQQVKTSETEFQLQGLKLLKTFMDNAIAESNVSYQELSTRQATLETKLNDLQTSLSTLVSLLKK